MAEQRPEGYIHTTYQDRLQYLESLVGVRPASELKTPEDWDAQFHALKRLVFTVPPLTGRRFPNGSYDLCLWPSLTASGGHYGPPYFNTLELGQKKYGAFKPGDILYEVSSGTAMVAFTWLASRLGYQAKVFVPKRLPPGRKQEAINFGAELVDIPGYIAESSREMTRDFLAVARAEGFERIPSIKDDNFNLALAENDQGQRMCLVNHSVNGITPRSMALMIHQAQLIAPDGQHVDYIISAFGNGTSTTGMAQGRDDCFPQAKVVGVEAWESPVQFKKKYPELFKELGLRFEDQQMFGLGVEGIDLPFAKHQVCDEIRLVKTAHANHKMVRENFLKPSLETIGRSSAACMLIAEQLAEQKPGCVTLRVVYDSEERYGQPVEVTGEYDQTHLLHARKRLPGTRFWRQRSANFLHELPATPAGVVAQIYTTDEQGRLISLDQVI